MLPRQTKRTAVRSESELLSTDVGVVERLSREIGRGHSLSAGKLPSPSPEFKNRETWWPGRFVPSSTVVTFWP